MENPKHEFEEALGELIKAKELGNISKKKFLTEIKGVKRYYEIENEIRC